MILKAFMKHLKTPIQNQRGIALLMAVSVMAILLYLAMEVMYDSNVEYIVNSQDLNRIKAFYAAKSGVDLSLLRIKIYNQIKKNKMASANPFLDQIWKFPIVWPLPVTDAMGSAAKDEAKKISKESFLDATFAPSIDDESSKLDINDLVSPSKVLREAAKKQLLNTFAQKMKDDQDFQQRYSNFNFEELVNNIADWMSGQAESLNGGDKRIPYKDMGSEELPPNRGFRTVEEIRLVAKMNDELFALIEPRITIYGMRGVNPNTATKEVIMALDSNITSDAADKAIERRGDPNKGGPFKESKPGEESDFQQFLEQQVGKLNPEFKDIPLVYGSVVAFKISSIGEYAKASSKLTAITLDIDQSATLLADRVKQEQKNQNPPPGGNPPPDPAAGGGQPTTPGQSPAPDNKSNSKGPPRIVYWSEE